MNTKILLIEDDRELVETILLIFKYHWPEAEIVYSYLGEPGIEMARNENPDALILDIGLPDISGFDVLKKIRLFSSIPIIVLTARSEEDDIVKALELEATDYVFKPFRQRELLARVQSHVNRWKVNEIKTMVQKKIPFDNLNRKDNKCY
jgi:DNA-binding response OmpR family regulator